MSLGVSIRIVRNFSILKCVLWIPTLFCRKNTGPLESSLMAMIKIKKTGDRKIIPRSAIIKSIVLFIFPYILFLLFRFRWFGCCFRFRTLTLYSSYW